MDPNNYNYNKEIKMIHLEKNRAMPTESRRQTTYGKHNTLVKVSQPLTNQLPPLMQTSLLHRERTPFSYIQTPNR